MGERPMRKFSRMPSFTETTGRARTPSSSKVSRTDEIYTTITLERGIEVDGEKGGQNGLAHHLLEGLAFGFALLTMALDTMAEDFVEEDCRGPTREYCRACVRIDHGRGAQCFEVSNHLVDGLEHGAVVGESLRRERGEGFVARKFHTVGGLGSCFDEEAVVGRRGLDHRAIARNEPAGFLVGHEYCGGVEKVAVAMEWRGVFAGLFLP